MERCADTRKEKPRTNSGLRRWRSTLTLLFGHADDRVAELRFLLQRDKGLCTIEKVTVGSDVCEIIAVLALAESDSAINLRVPILTSIAVRYV